MKNVLLKFQLFNNLYGRFTIHIYPFGDGVAVEGRVGDIELVIESVRTVDGYENTIEISDFDSQNIDLQMFRLEKLLKKSRELLRFYLKQSEEISKPKIIEKKILLATGGFLPHFQG